MGEKYIKFYQNFHKALQDKKSNHSFVQVSDSGVDLNGDLKMKGIILCGN